MISHYDYDNTICLTNLRSALLILDDYHRPRKAKLRDDYQEIVDKLTVLKNKVWDLVEVEDA
jgi:hypothetical protein